MMSTASDTRNRFGVGDERYRPDRGIKFVPFSERNRARSQILTWKQMNEWRKRGGESLNAGLLCKAHRTRVDYSTSTEQVHSQDEYGRTEIDTLTLPWE